MSYILVIALGIFLLYAIVKKSSFDSDGDRSSHQSTQNTPPSPSSKEPITHKPPTQQTNTPQNSTPPKKQSPSVQHAVQAPTTKNHSAIPAPKKNSTAHPPIAPGKNLVRAVILTTSGKHHGACVAAYDLKQKQLIRFVSNAETAAEIPFSEIQGISPLDIVEAEVLCRCPIGPQTENILVRRFSIHKVGRFSGSVEKLLSRTLPAGDGSFMHDRHERLLDTSMFRHSLELIPVKSLILNKVTNYNGGKTTRAEFKHNGMLHRNYRVTDFNYDLRKTDREQLVIPYAYLVVSIPKDEYIANGERMGYYKFVAAIFPVDLPLDSSTTFHGTNRTPIPSPNVANFGKNQYYPWTETEEANLLREYDEGIHIHTIAEMHGRSEGAIRARLKKLGKPL